MLTVYLHALEAHAWMAHLISVVNNVQVLQQMVMLVLKPIVATILESGH